MSARKQIVMEKKKKKVARSISRGFGENCRQASFLQKDQQC